MSIWERRPFNLEYGAKARAAWVYNKLGIMTRKQFEQRLKLVSKSDFELAKALGDKYREEESSSGSE